jgi:U-box domain/Sel1 repeat
MFLLCSEKQILRGKMPTSTDERNKKGVKKAKTFACDDLMCPITLELPLDPVFAEDGRVYEREAITRHILGCRGRELKSPITNAPMGQRLVSAPQTRSLIEALVESNILKGDLATVWAERQKEKKENNEQKSITDLQKKAKSGDARAMVELGVRYEKGTRGFEKDGEAALEWYERAHNAGNIKGTAYLGRRLCSSGVAKCGSQGLMYISIAAGQGSNWAAAKLGLALANGSYGLPKNEKEAICWLTKALGASSIMHMSDDHRDKVKRKLGELTAQTAH